MAEITIKFENNELQYDAVECSAKEFASVANASLHHLEVECLEKGEDISVFLSGIRNTLEHLESLQVSVEANSNKG